MGADKGVKRKSLGQQKQTPKKALKVESPKEALKLQTPKKNITTENVWFVASTKSPQTNSAENKRNNGKAPKVEEEVDDDELSIDQSSEDLDMDSESDEVEASEEKHSDSEVESDTDKVIVDNAKTSPSKLNHINDDVPSHCTVFVGHLDYAIVAEQILEHFNQSCQVVSLELPIKKGKNPGYGYMQLKDELSYKNALKLNHSSLGGRRINVEPARHSFQEFKNVKAATKSNVKRPRKRKQRNERR